MEDIRYWDVDGNGKSDLAWGNTSGEVVALWLMNDTTVGSSGFLGGVWTNWSIAQMNDVDGDGRADVVWRKSSGEVGL